MFLSFWCYLSCNFYFKCDEIIFRRSHKGLLSGGRCCNQFTCDIFGACYYHATMVCTGSIRSYICVYIGGSVCYWTYRFISREFERQNILKIRTGYDLVCPFVKLKVLYVWSDKLFYLFNCFYSVLSFRYGFCCKSIQ